MRRADARRAIVGLVEGVAVEIRGRASGEGIDARRSERSRLRPDAVGGLRRGRYQIGAGNERAVAAQGQLDRSAHDTRRVEARVGVRVDVAVLAVQIWRCQPGLREPAAQPWKSSPSVIGKIASAWGQACARDNWVRTSRQRAASNDRTDDIGRHNDTDASVHGRADLCSTSMSPERLDATV